MQNVLILTARPSTLLWLLLEEPAQQQIGNQGRGCISIIGQFHAAMCPVLLAGDGREGRFLPVTEH